MTTKERNSAVTKLLNGALTSIKTVIPIDYEFEKSRVINQDFRLFFGVLIGITGDIQGKLVFSGDQTTFGSIGERMFGMPLEGDMLLSFSGELGNMIAGGISTTIADSGTDINITAPTIMQGNTKLSGYKKALEITVDFVNVGKMNTYLLID